MPGSGGSGLAEYDPAAFDIPADTLLNFMKFRRSIRRFQPREIEAEKLDRLLEAGRFAPSGGNRQVTRYILLRDRKEELTRETLRILHDKALRMEPGARYGGMERYRERWISLYENLLSSGRDGLFYGAPCVLLVVACRMDEGKSMTDAVLAAAHMELMAHAQGLGACHIGFFSMAVELDAGLAGIIGLKKGEQLAATLALGYPDVRYYRTVERNQADITVL